MKRAFASSIFLLVIILFLLNITFSFADDNNFIMQVTHIDNYQNSKVLTAEYTNNYEYPITLGWVESCTLQVKTTERTYSTPLRSLDYSLGIGEGSVQFSISPCSGEVLNVVLTDVRLLNSSGLPDLSLGAVEIYSSELENNTSIVSDSEGDDINEPVSNETLSVNNTKDKAEDKSEVEPKVESNVTPVADTQAPVQIERETSTPVENHWSELELLCGSVILMIFLYKSIRSVIRYFAAKDQIEKNNRKPLKTHTTSCKPTYSKTKSSYKQNTKTSNTRYNSVNNKIKHTSSEHTFLHLLEKRHNVFEAAIYYLIYKASSYHSRPKTDNAFEQQEFVLRQNDEEYFWEQQRLFQEEVEREELFCREQQLFQEEVEREDHIFQEQVYDENDIQETEHFLTEQQHIQEQEAFLNQPNANSQQQASFNESQQNDMWSFDNDFMNNNF